MRHPLLMPALALAATAFLAPASQAADMALGQKLYSENCVSCHGAEKFSAADRKVNNLDSLKTFVQSCATNLSLSWFEDEVDAVSTYINQEFYKFK